MLVAHSNGGEGNVLGCSGYFGISDNPDESVMTFTIDGVTFAERQKVNNTSEAADQVNENCADVN